MKPIRLIAGFLTVGVWTLLSRVLGFARDILIASTLGAGPVADAFLVAFSLPNMFRRFFAEGAFNMAFVPMFSKRLEAGDDPHGFAQDAFAVLAFLLMAVTALGVIFTPGLVWLMASGFEEPGKFDLTVNYGRVAFPYIFFISLAALLSGVLNATGRFVAAAAAPVLLNIVFITVIVTTLFTTSNPTTIGFALSYAIPVAGIAQLALVWVAAKRAGFLLTLRWPRLTPELKQLAIIAAPAALAGGVVQVNLLVGRRVASYFDGAVSWLSYADRLYQLPLGVVAIAVGVVLLPDLSRRLSAGDTAGGRYAFSRATEFSLILTIPAAVALMVIATPLVSVLFQRGAFTSDDTAFTALAVMVYGLGLPAFVLQKTLQPLYFAREDTRSPFRYAVVAMVVNAVIAIGLSYFIGYIAAALATTLAGWTMVWLLWRGSRSLGEAAQLDPRFRKRIWRIIAASIVMGVVLWAASVVLTPFLFTPTIRYAALAILILIGIGTYFAAARLFGAINMGELRAALKR